MSIRILYEEAKETARQAFLNLGLSREQAEICATIHTQSSADGVSVLPQQMHPIRNVREAMLSVRVSVPLLQGIGA